ncbi:MAG: TonB-dependent receptor plug domain-containing protein, partial [Oleiphilaceae bacterium]|nr:TonB-dependent receptor plug domain-containing protein [Oleiphilaceae bacterium]
MLPAPFASTRQNPHRFIPLSTLALGVAVALNLAPALVMAQSGEADRPADEAAQTQRFNIEGGPLDAVLNRFALAADIDLSVSTELTRGKSSPGLSGSYSINEALQRLLAGTGLSYRVTGPESVTVVRASAMEEGSIRLEPLLVTSGRATVSTANVGEVTTATRFPVENRHVPRSVGTVGQELIEQTNSERDLGDVSNYVSGVTREPDIARSGNFFIRGFPVGVRATIDGLRNPRGTSSTRSFTVTDLALYERVEFLKGASALLYGQGEPGGNVNFVSKKPQFERAHSIELSTSSNDYYRAVADTTGPVNDELAYRVIGVTQNKNSPFKEPDQDDRLILNPSFLWQTANGGSVYFDYEYNDADVTGFSANAILIDGKVTEFATSDPVYKGVDTLETHNLRLHVEQPITAGWSLALDTAYSTQDNETNQFGFWSADDPFNTTSVSGFAFQQDRTDDGFVIRPELRGEFDIGNTRHRLAIGYMHNQYEGDFSR